MSKEECPHPKLSLRVHWIELAIATESVGTLGYLIEPGPFSTATWAKSTCRRGETTGVRWGRAVEWAPEDSTSSLASSSPKGLLSSLQAALVKDPWRSEGRGTRVRGFLQHS